MNIFSAHSGPEAPAPEPDTPTTPARPVPAPVTQPPPVEEPDERPDRDRCPPKGPCPFGEHETNSDCTAVLAELVAPGLK